MDMWIDLLWCAGTVVMALAAYTKIRDGSQPKGALVVMVLGLIHVLAVLTGLEMLAYVANVVMIVTGGLLIGLERYSKKKQSQLSP